MDYVEDHIVVKNLEMRYRDFLIQKNLNFEVKRGEIFVVMGGSGCGKSTLMRHLIGLQKPFEGSIVIDEVDLWGSDTGERPKIQSKMGILYQSGALWSSMTLAENVSLPIKEYTNLSKNEIQDLVSFKLSLVGLAGFEDFFPSEISGGMRKRAGLARAMALDPDILFFDEPSAGLDPVSSKRLDDLILELRDSFGSTIVIVTHELSSIFAIADNSIFLDTESKTIIEKGNPRKLQTESKSKTVKEFLNRGII
jgi:phospholipid/cholesterol/gamma-HCH transport system ATP-binding protein